MTAKNISDRFDVNVMKIGYGQRTKWVAFTGGNGTGEPVVEVAESYHLRTLAVRVARRQAKAVVK